MGLRISSRLSRIRCNPSYNVKEKTSVTTHLTNESMSLEVGPLIISKSFIETPCKPEETNIVHLLCNLNLNSQTKKKWKSKIKWAAVPETGTG